MERGFDGSDRLFSPEEVKGIAAAFLRINRVELKKIFTPALIDKHVLYGISPESAEEEWQYLGEDFELIGKFLKKLVKDGKGMVVVME